MEILAPPPGLPGDPPPPPFSAAGTAPSVAGAVGKVAAAAAAAVSSLSPPISSLAGGGSAPRAASLGVITSGHGPTKMVELVRTPIGLGLTQTLMPSLDHL